MSDQFIGQTLAEKYRIDSVLRSGAFGKIYRATHLLMDKPVTVKILAPALAVDENIVKQFSAEARTVSHISHPNILNVTDFGAEKNGAVYIVLEGADGEILKEEINREGKFSIDRTVKIATQTAAALSAAHAYRIVHGNLTPENILLAKAAVNSEETVKVLDFGAASGAENDLSVDENYAEHLEYRAPEQNASVAEIDERADVYALGVIVYEMLAGEVPYAADTPTALLTKQAENPPAPLSIFRTDLPAAVEPVILKALAKNPEMRYQTAQEFSDDLNRAANNFGDAVVVQKTDLSQNAKNNLWKTAFVVLAGISLLAIGLIYATSSKQTNPTTQLQTDINGQPVQPLNPATGMNEFGASNMMPYTPQMLANSNGMPMPGGVPQAVPNGDGLGDGYNPWARGVPPPGAPTYVPPGGQYIDPNNPNSIFMQDGTVLVPVPTNANVGANVKPTASPSGKPTPAPANTNTAQPTPAPTANPQPTPAKTPTPTAPKPTPQPTKTQPATAPEKRPQSGQEQNS
jgi:serine/threonine protein kinase